MNQNDLLLFILFKSILGQSEQQAPDATHTPSPMSFLSGDSDALTQMVKGLQSDVAGVQKKFAAFSKQWDAQENSGNLLSLDSEAFVALQNRVAHLENELKKHSLVSQNGSAKKEDFSYDASRYEGRIEGVESQVSALSLLIENTNSQLLQQNGQSQEAYSQNAVDTAELEFIREKMQTLEHQLNSMNQVFDWTREQFKNHKETEKLREEKHASENLEHLQKINHLESQVIALDKMFGNLNDHFVRAYEDLMQRTQNDSLGSDAIEERLNLLEEKLKLHGEYIDKITQKLYEKEKNQSNMPPPPIEKPKEAGAFSGNDLSYVQHLHKKLFKSEAELKTIFPDAFVIYQQHGDYPTSFFWVGEKMGLTYILLFRCLVTHSAYSFLPLLSNILTNSLVSEGKFMDTGSIMKAMNQELYELFKDIEGNKDQIQAGITVIDQTNAKMYFMGAHTDLLVNNSDFKVLEGDDVGLGEFPSEQQEFTRYDLNWSKNIKFYMIPSIAQRQKGIITRTNQLRYQDFEKQKTELIQYISSSVEEEFIMIGFSPDY